MGFLLFLVLGGVNYLSQDLLEHVFILRALRNGEVNWIACSKHPISARSGDLLSFIYFFGVWHSMALRRQNFSVFL